VYRIDFGEGRLDAKAVAEARVSHYGPEQGLGELMRNRIWPAPGGGLLFTSEQRVYRFDAAQDRFLPWEALPVDFSAPGYQNPTFYQSPQGSWLGTEDRVMELAKSGLGYLADSTALMGMGVGSSAFFQDPDGTLYMANGDGLFVYKPQRRAKQALPSVLIREVHLSKSGQLLLDPSQIGTSPLPIEYANNALQFSFALPDYHSEEESRFQYWLEGYEQRWSDWAELASKEYTNLREGRYVFKVRAKSALGAMTEVSTFAFEILPPWYRTVYAWVVYALGGLLLGYVALQAYTRRLQQAKARLERLVEQRTEEVRRQGQEILAKKVELEQQKEEIEAQAESLQVANRQIGAQHDALAQQKASLEVQHQELNAAFSIINKKNKDITASIQYAQRIQRAVLPARERLLAMLPAHLLLYWPKDIVSGDFYWVERLPDSGNLLVVAADCTGHGVPGAFMSLVGDSLLKQLVFHERVFEPAALLERMHEGVRQALSQTATGGQEGMDMAVCLLDMEAQEVRFAGAKRPLLYFEKGELEEIKGTRRSVGGSHFLEGTAFEQHRIPAGPDTVFYLHSDGIPDQVGGAQGRKLMSKRFKLALQRMARLPLEQQEARMAQMLQEWKEGEKQVDDILLLGFRMPYP
jgi:serine phosphatase RsbU (regulator of sigma subunit)